MSLSSSAVDSDSITAEGTLHAGKFESDGEKVTASRSETTWHMTPELQSIRDRDEQGGERPRKLGVTWQNLTIKGIGSDATFNENVLSQFYPFHKGNKEAGLKTIVDNSYGCVKPGEMLLVLGRPGSGCTTLLSVLANNRLGYEEVTGDIAFGNLSADEAKRYRGQIIMNTEEEIFFPTLTVEETIDFAARMKVPYHLPPGIKTHEEYAQSYKDFLLRSVGISHAAHTKVGDAFIRGVSGGERKRVSILECLTTRASVFCWDNSTRGLDASTALEWIKAIRAMTDVLGLTTIVTLYQAGNGIYEHFDKVLVLDGGKQIFYGPQREAVPFMEGLGFMRDPGSNCADFLTGVTVPTERLIAPGYEKTFPRTADEILATYDRSLVKSSMLDECRSYPASEEAAQNTVVFKEMIAHEKHRGVPNRSAVTADFLTQVKTAVIRQYQIMWGDRSTLFMKQGATVIQALLGGSLFYSAPNNSTGLFIKGGALFFSILYNALIALSEVTDSFTGRPILAKHRSFALYDPAAICIAQVAADLPILLFQVSHFGLILYFMVGLKMSAAAFFTYLATNYITALSMTALYRLIGAAFPTFDAATKVSGLSTVSLFVYMGYMIIKPQMHPWLGWIFWINPMAYGFEALLGNEFHDQDIPCVGPNLIPNGLGYTEGAGGQACAGVGGALPGATSLTGDDYLAHMSFSHGHIWRNFGINCAWWILFVALTIFFTSRWRRLGEGGRNLLVPREQQHKSKHLFASREEVEEQRVVEKPLAGSGAATPDSNLGNDLLRNRSILTWKNLTYTVKTADGDRVLLDNVQGYVKPGMLGALMGSSGAGKTTLLDVLAQRKTEGTIHGSVLVDGRPIPISFQRSAGYVEQLDIHEPLATVREALEFSALLRQSRNTSTEDKLRYVDTIVSLLELNDLEHTLVGRPGAGLSIEQRKRLTIAVELVAKPDILIFLDEPTSGLDGQAAYNTVRFLRKLADAGQAVLVTIHQPSAQLFAQFDTLLLLAKGGKTVYFGDVGQNASTIKEYFGRYGAPCPPDANPAEHMIDVVSGSGHPSWNQDWNQIWLQSPEHEQLSKDLDCIIAEAAAQPSEASDDGHEFAASMWTQVKLVTHRMNISLFRNTEYVDNKVAMHISLALINGFSFWMIGDSLTDLQQNLFTVFNFIFVAPGVISQLQPLFIDRRDIYEAREKKSKMYHWAPFVAGLIVSEIPYLLVCALIYYVCWYFTCGLPTAPKHAGSVFFVVVMYECLYTGIGQMIAAYTPNAVFAALVNPLVITTLVSFCGVMIPYSQIVPFWRYWIYYLDPFNYLMSSLLVFTSWDKPVRCRPDELAVFNPAPNQTCQEYLSVYQQGMGAATNLLNPDDTDACRVCQYTQGGDYLRNLNLAEEYYGWRNAGIVVVFVIGIYGLVFLMMKLRTKATKKAES
ncbi:ABC-2 type transporter domain-containing protein [Trichoderma sp. TUCIM 5745]